MKVAVTGASGFVARHLRRHLSAAGHELVSVSRGGFGTFGSEKKIVSGSYAARSVLGAVRGSDALVHLAGAGRQTAGCGYEEANVQPTRDAIDLCRKAGIRRIVYASGLGASRSSTTGYFISIYRAERSIAGSGLDYVILRPSYIVGRDDPLTKHLRRSVARGLVVIPGSGRYSVQPVHVDDAVRVLEMSAADPRFAGRTLDLVGPESITFERYVRLFARGSRARIRKTSLEDAYNLAINGRSADFGVDDLNILVGDFAGNHDRIRRLSGLRFGSVADLLKSGALA